MSFLRSSRGRTPDGAQSLPALGNGYTFQLRENLRHNLTRRPGSTLAVLLPALLIFAFYVYVGMQVFLAPSVKGLAERDMANATVLYTADGKQLSRLYEENRTYVPLDSMAAVLPKALIAIEDQRFYQHGGVSFRRTAGALLQTVKGNKQGGSTITMQLSRNAFTDVANDWILTRKIKEWITAVRINDRYSKEQVLEIYLNTVPLSYNTFGVEAASQVYFNRPAAHIDTLQAAALMAMLRGPTLYNPVQNPENNRRRRNLVLQQMAEVGFLTEAEAERLQQRDTPMDFQPVDVSHNLAPYFAEYVRQRLEDWAAENGYDLYRDGLRVYTTLDARLQQTAHKAVTEVMEDLQAVVNVSWSTASTPFFSPDEEAYHQHQTDQAFAHFWDTHPELLNRFIRQSARYEHLTDKGTSEPEALDRLKSNPAFLDSLKAHAQRLEAGLVAMRPDNGHLKAWVGGRNFQEDQYDHVYLSKRQPGSTFKPFVYATALDRGYRQNDVLHDARIEYVNEEAGQRWSPGNFGSETGELMTLKEGLAHSKNTITAQLIVDLGPGRVAETARRMGIKSDLQAVPSLGLGTSEVTLLEMVGAYGTLANKGRYQEPIAITRIENRHGRTVAHFQSDSRQALRASVAYGTLQMMEAVVTEGTGVRIRSYVDGGDWAAKTGTTQNNADGWFMLMHPQLVTGSWVGFNSPQIAFRTRYWGQGSHNALKVVGHFIENAGLKSASFSAPPGYEPPAEENEPRRDPGALFANRDNVSLVNDSLAAEVAEQDDPYGFGEDDALFSEDSDDEEDSDRDEATPDTAALRLPAPEEEGTAEAEGEASSSPADSTEEPSAADRLNQQQSLEIDGDPNGGGEED